MRLTFVYTPAFAAESRRLKLVDEDLQALEKIILARPEAGAVMRGTGGLRKLRFAPPSWHTGKRGAARVCYITFAEVEACYLVAIFAKNEASNLSPAGRAAARRLIESIRRGIERN